MLRTKLMLGFGLASLALVTAPLIMYMLHSSRSMQAARLEQLGIAPSKALLRVVATMEKAAAGDLTARASVISKDELGQIAGVLNRMLESLH